MVADLSRRKLFALGAAAAVAPVIAPLAAAVPSGGIMTFAEYARRFGSPSPQLVAYQRARRGEIGYSLRVRLPSDFKVVDRWPS